MNKSDVCSLYRTISFIKSEWSRIPQEANGTFSIESGKSQAYRDVLLALIKYFKIDIPCSPDPLPKNFDLKSNLGVVLQDRKTKI